MKNKKYMKWVGAIIVIMFLSTMTPANAVDTQEVEYEITDIASGMSIIIDYNPSLPEGGIPPPGDRRSFIFMTGMYELYEGVIRLVGVWFIHVLWFDGDPHYANWNGLVALEIVEGEYEGEYVFDDWNLNVWWYSENASLIPFPPYAIGYYWDPNENKLGYYHQFVDYTEDYEHIRYVDRTFTEDWSKPFTSDPIDVSVLYDWDNLFDYISIDGFDDVEVVVTNPDDTIVEYPMNTIIEYLQSKDAMYGSIISTIATSHHSDSSLDFRRIATGDR